MSDLLLVVRDLVSAQAVLLGAQTPSTTLLVVGAGALVIALVAVQLRGRSALLVDVRARTIGRSREADDGGRVVAQSDPDAPGRPRPRAPGAILG